MEKGIRAFLSHSSADKVLVRRIAEDLGRAAVVYDEYEFKTGEDFDTAIKEGLARSDIFVLFASAESLKRDWVKLEIKEAEKAFSGHNLTKTLTYIIDDALSIEELPEWMRRTRVERQKTAGLISLDIQRALYDKLRQRSKTYFVGRQAETESALELVSANAQSGSTPPIVIYGLNGIGRRSLLSAVARDHLSYPKLFLIDLKEGDLLPELYLKIIQRLTPDSVQNPREFLSVHELMPINELISRIIDALKSVCQSQALPVLKDADALSNYAGDLNPNYAALFDAIAHGKVDVGCITNRRIYLKGSNYLKNLRVEELSTAHMQNLIRLIGRDKSIAFDAASLRSLAIYARGYPPAAKFAVSEVQTYGIAHVVQNQAALVNFSADLFLRELKKDQRLSKICQDIMQVLSVYSPLPPEVLTEYFGLGKESFAVAVTHLVDFTFILPAGANLRISEPLRDAAYRAFSGLYFKHDKIAALLEAYLKSTLDDDVKLPLAQTLFRASLLSRAPHVSGLAVGFASDLIQVAMKSYFDQDYDLAIKYGLEAITMRPDSADLRRYIAQAFIRKEKYDEAEVHIKHLEDIGEISTAEFVRGFSAKKQGEYERAIEFYNRSLGYGRRGVAVHRELASCYYEIGDIEKANLSIAEAEKRSPHNRYIVDLRCTIALRTGDMDTAERTLTTLEKVDPSGFADHRRSTYLQAKEDIQGALEYALKAHSRFEHPPFEVVANVTNCHIEAGDGPAALNAMRELEQRFRGLRHNARVGLQCEYETRFGSIDTAVALWNQLLGKESPQHIGLRLGILKRKTLAKNISSAETAEYESLALAQAHNDNARATRMLGSSVSRTDTDG